MSSKRSNRHPVKRIAIDIAGFGLVILGILLGWLPGPGGIPLIVAGLGILALNYQWAESLLKDFDKKRVELTDRFLMVDPLTSKVMDGFALILLLGGAWLVIHSDVTAHRAIGVSFAFAGLTVLLSNQKRIERIVKKLKSKK